MAEAVPATGSPAPPAQPATARRSRRTTLSGTTGEAPAPDGGTVRGTAPDTGASRRAAPRAATGSAAARTRIAAAAVTEAAAAKLTSPATREAAARGLAGARTAATSLVRAGSRATVAKAATARVGAVKAGAAKVAAAKAGIAKVGVAKAAPAIAAPVEPSAEESRSARPSPVPRSRATADRTVPASTPEPPPDSSAASLLDRVPDPRSAADASAPVLDAPVPEVVEVPVVEVPVVEVPVVEVPVVEALVAGAPVGLQIFQPRAGGRHHRPEEGFRRPALVLAGALVAALGAGLVSASTSSPAGAATSSSASVSVARELGLSSATKDLATPLATARLRELAVSRATREAEQTQAQQTQAAQVQAAQMAAAEAARPKMVFPTAPGTRFTSGFGRRWGVLHAGIDLAGPLGTPEYAAEDGVVLKAGPASGFGQAVYIQHANGDVTVYGHMEKILVTAGQVVKAGDTIALMGAEGESTGSHLHFEVHVGGLTGPKIDPVPWLRERGIQI